MTILCEILFVIVLLILTVLLVGTLIYSITWAISINKKALKKFKRMKK